MRRTTKVGIWSGALAASLALGLGASLAQGMSLPPVEPVGQDTRPIPSGDSYAFGAYDPHGDFSADKTPVVEGLFLPWEDIDLSSLPLADEYASARGRSLLISMEPWSWDQTKRVSAEDLRRGVLSGKYDGNIAAICTEVGKLKSPTTIRWAQEMESTNPRFTWSNWPPADYIKAYRKVVEICRPLTPGSRYMWSPKGLDNLDPYYPGDDWVDDIGLSVFGLQAYDRGEYGHDRSFAEILAPGYDLVVKYNKPIWVAELGYSGDVNYVSHWARTVLPRDPKFPKLVGVVYFNDKDVVAWPNYGVPNWRVVENTVE